MYLYIPLLNNIVGCLSRKKNCDRVGVPGPLGYSFIKTQLKKLMFCCGHTFVPKLANLPSIVHSIITGVCGLRTMKSHVYINEEMDSKIFPSNILVQLCMLITFIIFSAGKIKSDKP